MHYFIDGYNLLFRIVNAADEIHKQRTQLIEELQRKVKFLKLHATLVFDSYYQPGESLLLHFDPLAVVFTDNGQTADDYILNALKSSEDPTNQTVVTSDKRLAWRSRRRLAKTETVEDFMSRMNQRVKNRKRKIQPQNLEALAVSVHPKKTQKFEPPKPVEDCFDYYLDAFSQQALETDENLKHAPQEIKKRKKSAIVPVESDFDRWLRLFEMVKD